MKKTPTRKCLVCEKRFEVKADNHWICSFECAKVSNNEKVNKKKAEIKKKDWTKEKAVLKMKTENWKKKLQTKVQEIARIIDHDLPCLARNYNAKQLHGGHVYAKGGNSSMALNLHNIHRQSAQSNHWQNDDGLLREGVVREYGQAYMDFISDLRRTPQLTLNNMEWHDKYQLACKISKSLQKNKKRLNCLERIALRNQINTDLGIYPPELSIYNL